MKRFAALLPALVLSISSHREERARFSTPGARIRPGRRRYRELERIKLTHSFNQGGIAS